ncbi:MAG: FAD-dependent oxidoreductase [Methylococcaceae bacterium]|nr:FAD-dependent oxidoreductase [Methylococcaceae bacterium]
MTTLSDVTIIGGGIIGLLTARECLLAGLSVTVMDKGQMGQESSWAGGGILLPLYPWRQAEAISQLVMHSLTLYPALIEELNIASGIDPECVVSGMLITKNPDIEAALAWCTEHAIANSTPPESLIASLTTAALNPLWLPEIRQVRNPRLLQAVQADLKLKGVSFITDCELIDLQVQQRRVQSIFTTTGRYAVKTVILTTGAWTGGLWQRLFPVQTFSPPIIHPIKGQMLLFDTKPKMLLPIVLDEAHYLIPRLDGKILVGSTVERCDFNKNTDTETKAQLTDFAQQLFPALRQYPIINHWAGLRPGTEQGIPYIALHPELENLSINAGHFRNGLAMAPASAQLLVDLLLKRAPKIALDPYQFNCPH